MAISQHHDHADHAVVTTDDGPSTVLIGAIVLMLVGFLIWLFAFSGIVLNRGPSTNQPGTTVNNTNEAPAVPGSSNTNTNTNPAPATSP